MWFLRKVKKGTATGRKIGFPTLNFNVSDFGGHYDEGVYVTEVKIGKIIHHGALYFGPRLSTGKTVLEMYVIGFNKMIYGEFISFRVIKKIRQPKSFGDLEGLKKQIEEDIERISK